jgi:hypothetical protein
VIATRTAATALLGRARRDERRLAAARLIDADSAGTVIVAVVVAVAVVGSGRDDGGRRAAGREELVCVDIVDCENETSILHFDFLMEFGLVDFVCEERVTFPDDRYTLSKCGCEYGME